LPLGAYPSFRGQAVDDTSVLIAYTRTGDANLDGVVNDDDVTIVGANFAPRAPNANWLMGDFDYNGFVDDDDVTLLGAFYQPGVALTLPSPEGRGVAGAAAGPPLVSGGEVRREGLALPAAATDRGQVTRHGGQAADENGATARETFSPGHVRGLAAGGEDQTRTQQFSLSSPRRVPNDLASQRHGGSTTEGSGVVRETRAQLRAGPADLFIQTLGNGPGPDGPGYPMPALRAFANIGSALVRGPETRAARATLAQLANDEALIDLLAESMASEAAGRSGELRDGGPVLRNAARAPGLWPV
jgi:hypothetical protein